MHALESVSRLQSLYKHPRLTVRQNETITIEVAAILRRELHYIFVKSHANGGHAHS